MKGKAKVDLEFVRKAIYYNDESSYAKLLKRYRDSVYYMILKIVHKKEDAENLTIEVFGKAFNQIHNYDQKSAFSTWLFRIAVNNSIDFIRKKRMDEPIESPKHKNHKPSIKNKTEEFDPFISFNKKERKIIAQELVNQMPDNYKELTTLRYFKEYSFDKIARELNLPIEKVKTKLTRGNQLIESIFDNYGKSYKF